MDLLTYTYLLLAALLVGILLDWYTTKIGLSLGLKETYPLFKGRKANQILIIKLAGFGLIAYALLHYLYWSWHTPFVTVLAVIQYWAAWLNWKKIKAIRAR